MGSQLFEVLRQGIWASITGGWFHDPRQPIFTNTLHLYLWLLLLALPLTLCIYFTSTFVIWSIYCGAIGVLFICVKIINARFHHLFDTTDPIEDPVKDEPITSPSSAKDSSTEAKPKKDAPRTDGITEADEIELQVLPSIPRGSRAAAPHCEVHGDVQMPSTSRIQSGQGFKVDVHRKESSSSSRSSNSSITSASWKGQTNSQQIPQLDNDEQISDGAGLNETVLISEASAFSQNEITDDSLAQDFASCSRDASSSFTKLPIDSDSKLLNIFGHKSDLRSNSIESTNLKGTKSLELGAFPHQDKRDSLDDKCMRRALSTTETELRQSKGKHRSSLRQDTHSQPTTPKKKSKINRDIDSHDTPDERGCQSLQVLPHTIPSADSLNDDHMRRSKSEECESGGGERKPRSSNVSEDESDDGARSSTPLLTRRGSSTSTQSTNAKSKDQKKDAPGANKKVSFTQSADGQICKNYSDKDATGTSSWALTEKGGLRSTDEVVSDIPLPSNWFSQAMNVAVKAISSKNNTSQDSGTAALVDGDDGDDHKSDVESVRSEDSQRSHSLVGLRLLYETNDECNNKNNLRNRSASGDDSENSKPGSSQKLQKTEFESLPNRDRKPEKRGPPRKPPRTMYPRRPTVPGSTNEGRIRRHGHSRTLPSDLEGILFPAPWRSERETSPRILERLLEENHDSSTSRAGTSATALGQAKKSTNNNELEWEFPNLPALRRDRGRENRFEPGASALQTNPFLQSAQEIRQQLKKLGPQNSFDISFPGGIREFSESGGSRHLPGSFRPRDETVHCDIDNSTSTVNRHKRLRRLAHSRRSLERRREAPISSPSLSSSQAQSAGPPGSHVHEADSHDDTTEGAVHYFQDELGNWHSYTFGGKTSKTTAVRLDPAFGYEEVGLKLDRNDRLVPRQGCSTSAGPSLPPPLPPSFSLKSPASSSESWSSASSSELAIDPSSHKSYTSYRRPTASYSSHVRNPSMSCRCQGITHHTFCPMNSPVGTAIPSPMPSMPSLAAITPDYSATTSASVHAIGSRLNGLPMLPLSTGMQRSWQRNPRDVLQVLTESFLERRRTPAGAYHHGQDPTSGLMTLGHDGFPISSNSQSVTAAELIRLKKLPRYYYTMKILPFVSRFTAQVWFDRLKLMAVFDRNRTFVENLLAVFLAISVACLGSFMLHQGYYQDLCMVLLCFVMASCQFSLLKSVQPDAASPTHGFNRLVTFSRPIYFCLCGSAVLFLQFCIDNGHYDYGIRLYQYDFTNQDLVVLLRDFNLVLIECFPILFSIGLFPQINTFLLYVLEQIDMHVYGGNASANLTAACTSIFKSWIGIGMLYGFVYGALSEAQSTQHILFSIFCGLIVATSYHLSRCASDPSVLWSVLKQQFCPDEDCFGEMTDVKAKEAEEQGDPLPKKLRDTVNARLKSDAIVCTFIGLVVFALHGSTVFKALQPGLSPVLRAVAIAIGFILHYLYPQFRKQLPCLLVAHPILRAGEYNQFEVRDAAKLMWFERIYVILQFVEKNVIYILMFVSSLAEDAEKLVSNEKFGLVVGSFIVITAGLKAFRTSYSDPGKHYLIVLFTILFFEFDWDGYSETFIVNFFFMSIAFHKVYELWLKLQFVITYIAPWQITWGSAFHAFAQPFSVPHSAMLFLQAVVSSVVSAPLNPFLGSAIFITSYVRPTKFWERDYNTKRVDHSNTRLAAHLEKNPGADDNNLNSIFYEHLTRSLQDSLCGDLTLGRWGMVSQGDCFVLASDYLNCLVHIVEVGNGLVTFQMRGLEFRGTYCQQREVEAISEGVEEDEGCCCCEPGHLPHLLSANAAFSQRWLAWEVTVSKYVLEGYSISDNSAVSMLQVFDLRKILITYYVKSIIYYAVRADKFEEWLTHDTITAALLPTLDKKYADLDPVFSVNIDEDYDYTAAGITRNSFCNVYHSWIQHCVSKTELATEVDSSRESMVVSLCFALSILARRALGVASHSNSLSSVEFFLYGLHALFKGDFRITSQRDEWVFNDMDLLRKVVSPAVRMSLKLHQDHFMCPDDYDDNIALFDAISYHDQHLVISHECDPAWRSAVLAGTPSLLALRHVLDDGADEYKIIMLNKRHLSFRVIKLNRECVRGLWAGQQQELVYLRNRDPERGSIQNAKQALRNIINSSCDQPIGYPIYVSPLTTSYADSHPQLTSLVGGPLSLQKLKDSFISLCKSIRRKCEGCSSGSSRSLPNEDAAAYGQEGSYAMTAIPSTVVSAGINLSGSQSLDGSQIGGSSIGRGSLNRANFNRGSVASNVSGSFGKPSTSTLASLTGFLTEATVSARDPLKEKEMNRDRDVESVKVGSLKRVRIIDANQVFDGLNLGRRIDVLWPDDETMKLRGGRSYWKNWVPEDGMEGVVVHKWIPGHRDPKCRSITEKTILLLKIEDKYVPIAETGVAEMGVEA